MPRIFSRLAAAFAALCFGFVAVPSPAAPSLCEKTRKNGSRIYKILEACLPEKGQSELIDFASLGGDTGYAFVLTVAKSGGDFSSVADALDSISDASAEARYLVWVAPGVYEETGLVEVDSFVHLRGSGQGATVIRSARSDGAPSADAATVSVQDRAALSDLAVLNDGTGTFGIAVHLSGASRGTRIRNVHAEASGEGGIGHYAMYLDDAEPVIEDSLLRASGTTGFGTSVSAAVGVVNAAGGFPRPLIRGSRLIGGNGDPDGLSCAGNSGTGFALQGVSASPEIVDSTLCGDFRGVFLGTSGQAQAKSSELQVSSTGGSFLIETSAAGTAIVVHSGVFYAGNKFTGTGGLVCTASYKSNFTAASDGNTSGTACN